MKLKSEKKEENLRSNYLGCALDSRPDIKPLKIKAYNLNSSLSPNVALTIDSTFIDFKDRARQMNLNVKLLA